MMLEDGNIYIKNLWRWKCGLPEIQIDSRPIDVQSLRTTEWSRPFETLMRNRLVLGSIRYGKLGASKKPKYNRVASIIKRIEFYKDTGNKEHLVDVANLCLCEFVECTHPKAHFKALDGDVHHTSLL